MQNLKKAFKKLTGLGAKKPAQAAKKAPTAKKKTAALPAKKVAAKAKKPALAAKKAKPAAKAAAAKPAVKDNKKKAVPAPAAIKKVAVAKVPVGKAVPAKAAAKPIDKIAAKPVAKPVAPEKPAKVAKAPAPEVVEKAPKAAKVSKKIVEEPVPEEEIVLTDAEGRRYCRVKECDQVAAVDLYCRYHYLLFWKNIQNRKKILSEGKLARYIEELTARYPDKYLEMLRKDLRSEKEFTAAIQELEIDESSVDSEYEDEAQSYLEEVRGMGGGSTETSARDDDDF